MYFRVKFSEISKNTFLQNTFDDCFWSKNELRH